MSTHRVAAWVGANTPTPVPVDPDKVEAGLIGLLFFLGFALAVLLLVFSMRKHLGRIDVTRHQRERRGPGPGPPAPGGEGELG